MYIFLLCYSKILHILSYFLPWQIAISTWKVPFLNYFLIPYFLCRMYCSESNSNFCSWRKKSHFLSHFAAELTCVVPDDRSIWRKSTFIRPSLGPNRSFWLHYHPRFALFRVKKFINVAHLNVSCIVLFMKNKQLLKIYINNNNNKKSLNILFYHIIM